MLVRVDCGDAFFGGQKPPMPFPPTGNRCFPFRGSSSALATLAAFSGPILAMQAVYCADGGSVYLSHDPAAMQIECRGSSLGASRM